MVWSLNWLVKASCILHIAKFNCSVCGMTQFKRLDFTVNAPVKNVNWQVSFILYQDTSNQIMHHGSLRYSCTIAVCLSHWLDMEVTHLCKLAITFKKSFFHSACIAPFPAHDGSCFYVSTGRVNWETAKTKCENIGGHLVMIKCAEQQQKVVDFLSGYSKCLRNTALILGPVGPDTRLKPQVDTARGPGQPRDASECLVQHRQKNKGSFSIININIYCLAKVLWTMPD